MRVGLDLRDGSSLGNEVQSPAHHPGWAASLLCAPPRMHAKSLQSCPTLCNPMDCSPPGSSLHGILQARALERGAIAFSVLYSTGNYIQFLGINHNGKEYKKNVYMCVTESLCYISINTTL